MQSQLFGRKHATTDTSGFTIVELLIVIVIIAILATITIISYNGVSRNAARSALRNDVSQSVRMLQNHRTINSDFPATLSAVAGGLPNSDDTAYEYTATSTTFCLTASSHRAQTSYYVDESNVIQEGTCSGHFGLNLPPLEPSNILTVGHSTSCSLAFDEAAYCWGVNTEGQGGNGDTASSLIPTAVLTSGALAGKRVTAVSTGNNSTCAIASGQSYCWGNQLMCQLGVSSCTAYSTEPNLLVPTATSTSGALNGKTLTQITVGYQHACALSATGGVYCWGATQYGRLGGGVGGTSSIGVSQPIDSLAGGILAGQVVTDVSAADGTTCAVANGLAYCWGDDGDGQLGNGTDESALQLDLYTRYPIAVDTSGELAGKTVTDIEAGGGGTTRTVCAIANGAPYCWGDGTVGQLGNGATTNSESPVAVDMTGELAGKTVTDISVGQQNHVCVIADGKVYCWGTNASYGKLGNGNQTSSYSTPTAVSTSGVLNGKTLVAVDAGYANTCVMSVDLMVFCWGHGAAGRLGNGTSPTHSSIPVLVTDPTP